MNKKAQSPFYVLFAFVVFVIVWIMFLGNFLNIIGQNYLDVNGSTGLMAFFMANLNLWVFFGMLIAFFAYGYFTQ